VPTFETQKTARTYILDIPARAANYRTARRTLAQNRLSYNLEEFPTPLDFRSTGTQLRQVKKSKRRPG